MIPANDITPVLSISITTRNRATFIGETLDSIIPQLSEQVELVVHDGASTDETQAVIAEYQRRYPQLRYVRENDNNGPDRDFSLSVELCRGEYCWLMTDDDLLRPGAVSTVCRALASRPSLVIVNAVVKNADMSEVLEERRLPAVTDCEYGAHELDRLFADTGAYLSFIGGVVIRRSVWLERDRERYFGSLFIHVGVLFQKPLPGSTRVIAEPLIAIRYGNAKWQSRQFEIWMLTWPRLVWSFEHIASSSRAAVSAAHPWRDVSRLLHYRAKGAYSVDIYRRYLKQHMTSRWDRLRVFVVALVPGAIANAAALFACFIQQDRSGRGKAGPGQRILDLRNSPYYFGNWLQLPRNRGT